MLFICGLNFVSCKQDDAAITPKNDDDVVTPVDVAPEKNNRPLVRFLYTLPPDLIGDLIYAGTPLSFSDRSTDDGSIVSTTWIFDNTDSLRGSTVEYVFDQAGDHKIKLKVVDNLELSADTTFNVVVQGVDFPKWQRGYLDIHHINTARGDAKFFIFPDGTNLLFDAGDKFVPGSDSDPDFPIHPNGSKTAGEWIAHYIRRCIPDGSPQQIDHMVISHFHIDHLGRINEYSPRSKIGNYQLGGVTQVADLIPMRKIIDRAYPDYNYPVDLIKDRDDTENFVKFLKFQMSNKGVEVERLNVGSADQIKMLHGGGYDFRVVNLYAGGELWTGGDYNETRPFNFSEALVKNGEWNENPLSIALRIEYGRFDYYTGGDITGTESWPDFDVESSLGPIVGEVDAMTTNHHGYKDATNQNFVNALIPQVAIQQTSDDDHANPGVLSRLKSVNADIFTSNLAKAYTTSAIADYYRSLEGHVVIRVYEGGNTFEVFILSDRSTAMPAIKKFGPYQSR